MYNKLFTKILDSSIWLEPDGTRLVWLTLLASMDADGFASFASVRNLAHRARVDLAVCQTAVEALEAADADSADPDQDGRRVERVPGGWIVLNALKYRELVTRDTVRQSNKVRARRYRERRSRHGDVTDRHAESVTARDDNGPSRNVTQSEAYAEARSRSEAIAETGGVRTSGARSATVVEGSVVSPRQGGAPLHISHKTHAQCGRICLPASLFDEFKRRRNHDDADAELRAWALEIERQWGPGGPFERAETGDAFDFWRARYAERWPPDPAAEAPSRQSTKTARTLAAAARFANEPEDA